LVLEHKDDCPDAAVTGKYILRWTENDDLDAGLTKRMRKLAGISTPGQSAVAADGTPLPVKGKPGRKPKLVDGSVPAKTPKKPAAGKILVVGGLARLEEE
jgi:hypothetical protein